MERTDQELVRIEKANRIREMGMDPFGHRFDKAGAQRQEKNCAPVNPVNPPLLFFSGHHPTMPAFWKCFLSRRWPNNVPRIARTAVMTIPKSMSAGEVTIENCIFSVLASKPLLTAIS